MSFSKEMSVALAATAMEIRQRILDELTGIESRFGVTILFACESGSRAWGVESTDSDYDVRFVYWHGLDWYLSTARTRDVIELPISGLLDINGWELRKALGLARRSNPTLLEWIDSPILYREHPVTAERFRALVRQGFSPATCFRSYLHMAQGNFREYLRGEAVWTKKYQVGPAEAAAMAIGGTGSGEDVRGITTTVRRNSLTADRGFAQAGRCSAGRDLARPLASIAGEAYSHDHIIWSPRTHRWRSPQRNSRPSA